MKTPHTTRKQVAGILIVISAAIMWGSTGVAGEYLINQRGLDAAWLTTYRTTLAGFFMIILLYARTRDKLFRIWRNRKDALQLILFGILGIGLNLYVYMLAVEYTNAPTATTLQHLAPPFIVIFTALREKAFPTKRELAAVGCALTGVFAITTHGSIRTLAITPKGLVIGLISALLLSFYNLFPRKLLHTYGSVITFAWGQFVAGILMNIILHPIWRFSPPSDGRIDLPLILVLLYQLTFGTMISYCIYLIGITYIGPSEASMLSSIEPVATALLAAVLLATPLVLMDYIGIILISLCVALLSLPSNR